MAEKIPIHLYNSHNFCSPFCPFLKHSDETRTTYCILDREEAVFLEYAVGFGFLATDECKEKLKNIERLAKVKGIDETD
jgi:hypothetical protein